MKDTGQPTDALVLRRFDYSETSQIARLYTRDFGRVSVIAKGVKKPNADLKGPIDLFCHADVAIRGRRQDELQVLTRYHVRTGFPGLRRDLEPLMAAFYLAELLCEGTRDFDPNPDLFDLYVTGLGALEDARAAEVDGLLLHAELGFLRLTGFTPAFDRCVSCGREAAPGARARVSPGRGGLVCSACVLPATPGLVELSAGQRRTLIDLQTADPARARVVRLLSRDRSILRRLLDSVLEHVLEKELRSAEFLDRAWA